MVNRIEDLKMEIQLAVMSLLPMTASKLLLIIGMLQNKDGKYFYNQDSPKLFHMSKDDCDIALQTLIDNGFVDVTNIGNETFEISINYGRFEDFDFTLDELLDKEDIKLSTKVTFRKSDVDRILDMLDASEKDEVLRDILVKLHELNKEEEKEEEDFTKECLMLSKKTSRKVSE